MPKANQSGVLNKYTQHPAERHKLKLNIREQASHPHSILKTSQSTDAYVRQRLDLATQDTQRHLLLHDFQPPPVATPSVTDSSPLKFTS